MDTNQLFKKFNNSIRLDNSKQEKLKSNRDALRKKIKNYSIKQGLHIPVFCSQGSFSLRTNINPIEGSNYDLDDGVYFICEENKKKTPNTYHQHIKNAVEDHAKETIDKATCVRVIYTDGHHIDLPCYWLESNGNIPQLAHKSKNFIDSDPKKFNEWVENEISKSLNKGQLRRIIRYLKAWKNFREHKNSSLKLPSGFILTILACQNYYYNACDGYAFTETIKKIKYQLDANFTCYRPTVPTDENLLEKYSESNTKQEFRDLFDIASKAQNSTCQHEISKSWLQVFGNRFPLKEKVSKVAAIIPTVSATKPYLFNLIEMNSRSMINFNQDKLQEIQKSFPLLEYIEDGNCIIGKITFCSKYTQKKNKEWIIVSCLKDDKNSVSGDYTIKIDLNTSPIKVYETSGKIEKLAKQLDKNKADLHINLDTSCCLDFISTFLDLSHLSLSQFILNKVYPYFVWQAYYEKFKKIPPCGEYSHNFSKAESEFSKDLKSINRNSLCICGSGKKYKFCCMKKILLHNNLIATSFILIISEKFLS